jgi:hypothetical protein
VAAGPLAAVAQNANGMPVAPPVASDKAKGPASGGSAGERVLETNRTQDRAQAAGFEDKRTKIVSRMQSCTAIGGVMDPFGLLCCPAFCGVCGGQGCANRNGGADACCGDNIASAAVKCGNPPCLLGFEDNETIASRVSVCTLAGGVADDTGLRCCDSACGICGGKFARPCPSSVLDAP